MDDSVLTCDDIIKSYDEEARNPASCSCNNGKYLANIMDDSVLTCDEIIKSYDEEAKIVSTTFNEKTSL